MTTPCLRNALRILIVSQICFGLTMASSSWAQTPPNSLDNFLDDDDFEGPPPGAFPPNGAGGQKPFGAPSNTPSAAPDVGGGAPNGFTSGSGSAAAGGAGGATNGKGSKPEPRRKRTEPPNLLAKRPPNLANANDLDITDENFPDLIDSFDYPNADINDIVKAVSELTGRNFIVDPQVRGKITIIAPSRITVAEAYKAFLSALAINGLTVVPSGKFWKVKQAQNAQRDNLDTYSGNFSPTTDAMITRIVQLHHISVKEVYNSLGPILQSRLGEMRPYEPTNTLIISDYGSNIERIMKIIHQLDVPGFEEQLEVIRVRYAKAGDLSKLVDQIINKGKNNQNQGGNAFTAGIPRFTPLGATAPGTGNEAFSLVIPDDRTNSLIVVGNSQGIDKIKKLVTRLDFRIRPEDAGGVYVYYVRFNDAEKIATTLTGLAQAAAQTNAQTPAAGAGPGGINPTQPVAPKQGVFGGDVKIASDKTTNSLIVTASKQDYEVVRAILSKLDVPRDQVFVEAIIAELQVQSTKSWGITYYNLVGGTYAGRSGFNSTGNPAGNILSPANDSGAILGFGGGGTVSITDPTSGAAVTVPSLIGFLNFLSTQTNINVLSTPQIMALDNEEAEIEVGDTVPVSTTQTATTGSAQSQLSVDRQDLTIKLNIKPHISPGSNTMRLEINQQIRDIAPVQVSTASNLAANAISTTKRFAKTNAIVRDGDTIVIGGLMKDSDSVQVTKIPLLGDIPIIGWLFKGKQHQMKKQNLVMFLTPRIIRNKQDVADVLKAKVKERNAFIQREVGGKDTQDDFINTLKIKTDGQAIQAK